MRLTGRTAPWFLVLALLLPVSSAVAQDEAAPEAAVALPIEEAAAEPAAIAVPIDEATAEPAAVDSAVEEVADPVVADAPTDTAATGPSQPDGDPTEEAVADPQAEPTAPADPAQAADGDESEAADSASEGTGGDSEEEAAAPAHAEEKPSFMKKFAPILILLVVVAFVIGRLPKVEGVEHTSSFRRRRVMNWLPLGLTYAFLYMGRYNLKVSKFAFEEMQDSAGGALMGNADFGIIFMVGVWVYGCSFLINGPLTDKHGGKLAILLGAGGAAVMNGLMGLASLSLLHDGPGALFLANNFVLVFSILYGGNMYFQSFGAVAIVKCNAPWFHVRERGVFGAIFGILISLGIYFAFDLGYMILGGWGLIWVFFVPTIALSIFWFIDVWIVKNTPGDAGLVDFDTADASSGDDGPRLPALEVFKRMLSNPVIITIALIEFCSGFLRQAPMQWFRTFAKQTDAVLGLKSSFVFNNWGMLLCCAGILGGVMAGIISDRVFQSRRGPVAGILYGAMVVFGVMLALLYDGPSVTWLVIIISMCVIGVHGMLSGTASMDFGGKKNVGIAVGIIDGFVYLGTGVMSLTYAIILPEEHIAAGQLVGPVTNPDNWLGWPAAFIPMAAIGLILALAVWNAKPKEVPKPLYRGQRKVQWVLVPIIIAVSVFALNAIKNSRDQTEEAFWSARKAYCEIGSEACEITDPTALAANDHDCETLSNTLLEFELEAASVEGSQDAAALFIETANALCESAEAAPEEHASN